MCDSIYFMANKKYYVSENIEFQNGDKTNARQLTIKRLKLLTDTFNSHDENNRKNKRRIERAIEAERGKKGFNEEEIIERVAKEIEEEDGDQTYIDVLMAGALIALASWGVKDQKEKNVEVDIDYIEENLDYPTLTRICEIAGSMELGDADGDDPGK